MSQPGSFPFVKLPFLMMYGGFVNVSVEFLNLGSTFLLFISYCAVCTTVITRPTSPLTLNIVSGREGDRNTCGEDSA